MGTAKFETIVDFAAREVDIVIRCRCGHSVRITPEAFAARLGWGCRVAQTAACFRCSLCGRKAARLLPAIRVLSCDA